MKQQLLALAIGLILANPQIGLEQPPPTNEEPIEVRQNWCTAYFDAHARGTVPATNGDQVGSEEYNASLNERWQCFEDPAKFVASENAEPSAQ